MNEKINHFSLFTATLVLVSMLSSCQKSDRSSEMDIKTSREYLIAEVMFNDVFKQIHTVAIQDSLKGTTLVNDIPTCAKEVTVETTLGEFPKTLTLDFGKRNKLCDDGRKRRGKIIAVFNQQYPELFSSAKITTDDYYIDNFKLEGQKSIRVAGLNGESGLIYAVDDNDVIITKKTTHKIFWTSSKTITWLEGVSTFDSSDDVFSISKNNFSGTATQGNSFSGKVIEEMRLASSCNWIVSGTVQLTPNNLSPRTIDFGNSCSNEVEISYLGNSKTIAAH